MKKLPHWPFIPRLIVILVIFILLEISLLNFHNFKNGSTHSDIKAKLSDIRKQSPKVFDYIRQNLHEIVNQGGISEAVKLSQEAFRQEAITMYECHTLAHLIGHYSKLKVPDNLNILVDTGVDYCEGGFKHGLEAEIALQGLKEGLDFRPDLYNFCSHLLQVSSVGDCYHGAGHEFMRETMEPKKALALCNTLTDGPVKDITNCYNGVFSEYTNLVGGVDGETGYRLANPSLKLNTSPMEFCNSLDNPYQIPCALELNGASFGTHSTLANLEQSLNNCINNKYEKKLQIACIRSGSAVFYQHQLPKENTIVPPEYILSWPEDLRRAYIDGAATEMSQFIQNGVQKDWQSFCNSLLKDDYEFCKQILDKNT